MTRAVVLVSGGLDSATVLAIARVIQPGEALEDGLSLPHGHARPVVVDLEHDLAVVGAGQRDQAQEFAAIHASRFASSSAASHLASFTRCSCLSTDACGCILPNSIAIRMLAAGSRRSVSVGGALVSGTS